MVSVTRENVMQTSRSRVILYCLHVDAWTKIDLPQNVCVVFWSSCRYCGKVLTLLSNMETFSALELFNIVMLWPSRGITHCCRSVLVIVQRNLLNTVHII